MNIGFIGLGIMGKPMAKNLIKNGHTLYINDWVDTAYPEMVELGAFVAKTPCEVAKNAKVIITMLPNTPNVLNVVNGIIDVLTSGHILIDMSSISPSGTLEIAQILETKNVKMLDAPVSGGEAKAKDGTLSIMIGGEADVFEKYKCILECMGSSIVLIGEIGAGNVAKLVNQMIVASTLAAISEAMKLARLYGVDENKVRDAIKGGMAGSAVMDSKLTAMIEGNFKAGFRADLQIKDLSNAMIAAKERGFDPRLTSSTLDMLKELSAEGFGENDHSILYTYYDNKGE